MPDAAKYVAWYAGESNDAYFERFEEKALSLAFLNQMHFHCSTWDGPLLCRVLREIGFVDAAERGFGEGADARLLRDQPVKAAESVYVEARRGD